MKKQNGISLRKKEVLIGFSFLAPWIIGFLVFSLYPVIYSVALSLNEIAIKPGGVEFSWKGLAFYNKALNQDTKFKLELGDTLYLILTSLPIVLVFSLIIALILNKKIPGRTFFRTVFFFPVIIMSGPVISNLLSKHTMDYVEGNAFITDFISTLPAFLNKPISFILSNLVLILWFSGIQILVFLTGLQKIGTDLYEASAIDGAGPWEQFWKITLPHLRSFALICAVYTVITVANYSENSVNKKIASHIFDFEHIYSFSSAMSWIYFLTVILILALVFFVFYFFGRKEER